MTEAQPKPSAKERGTSWLKEQHARHVVISKDDGIALELPLTVFAVGAILAPHLAVLGIVLALVTRHEVKVKNPPVAEAEAEAPSPLPAGEFPVGEEAADPNAGDETWPSSS